MLALKYGHTGQWGTTANIFLPYYAYRDLAGNFGSQDADLTLYVGPSSYIDNDLGKVSSVTVEHRIKLLRCHLFPRQGQKVPHAPGVKTFTVTQSHAMNLAIMYPV
eukprot:1138161-Pelagomonas_calceolata.AAC.9